MLRMVSNMDWCIQNAYSDESSENLGRCVLHGSSLACQSSVNVTIFLISMTCINKL